MNSSVKSVHFSKWLRKKIGSRVHFCRKYGWKSREILRWTQGDNFPKPPARAKLIYDLHLHIDQEYTSLLAECDEKLMRDYKEYKYEQEKIRRQLEKEAETD